MSRNKIVIKTIVILIILGIIIGISFLFLYQKEQEKFDETNTTSSNNIKPKVSQIYEKMLQGEVYTFSMILDENNKIITARKGETARIDLYRAGEHTTDIIKDGSTYLLTHKDKKYYEYGSNTIELTNLLKQFERTKKDIISEKGEETIEDTSYYYEQYKGRAEFLFKNMGENDEEASTKFYFKDNSLAYIKTILKNREELLKIELEYNINDISFEIPNDYEKVDE